MSITVPVPYITDYAIGAGRGEVEAHVLATLQAWIVPYVAAYERAYGLIPRSTPVPPTPASFHGGIDFETWESALMPELIVVTQPVGPVERTPEEGYAQWFEVQVGAICYVEGDQDATRRLADLYGTVLQDLLVQQGEFGKALDKTDPFATRTRLVNAGAAVFPDDNVRDILRETVTIRTLIVGLANDLLGPRVPPLDPYGSPLPWPPANIVEVEVTGEKPDGTPSPATTTVVINGTFAPPRTFHT